MYKQVNYHWFNSMTYIIFYYLYSFKHLCRSKHLSDFFVFIIVQSKLTLSTTFSRNSQRQITENSTAGLFI